MNWIRHQYNGDPVEHTTSVGTFSTSFASPTPLQLVESLDHLFRTQDRSGLTCGTTIYRRKINLKPCSAMKISLKNRRLVTWTHECRRQIVEYDHATSRKSVEGLALCELMASLRIKPTALLVHLLSLQALLIQPLHYHHGVREK